MNKAGRRALPQWGWAVLVVAVVALYLFPYSAALNNPNERTRVLQARAMVELGQLHIGETVAQGRRVRVRDLYGRESRGPFVNDVALVCEDPTQDPPQCVGKIYPAKAPGTSLLGVPALGLARLVGFVPPGPEGETRATWVLRVGGVLPWLLIGLWLVGRELARLGASPQFIARAILAAGLGTTLFTYSLAVVGHALAGVALLSGLVLLREAEQADSKERATRVATLAGFAAAWAVLLEYHAVVAVFTLSAWALFSVARKFLLLGFAFGGLLGLTIHAWLHARMFTSALRTGHFYLMTAHNRNSQAHGFLGIDGFHFGSIKDHLFDPYMGLVPIMPWLFLAFVMGWVALRRMRGEHRGSYGTLAVAGSIGCVYLLFVGTLGNWREMNGWSIGPRYLTPCLFPAVLFATHGWWAMVERAPRLARACAGLAGASVSIVVAITTVYPSPPSGLRNLFGELALPLLGEGYAVRNVLMAWGNASLWILAVFVLGLALWVAFGPDHGESRPLSALGVRSWALSGVLWLLALAFYAPTATDAREGSRAFCRKTVEGLDPTRESPRTFFE